MGKGKEVFVEERGGKIEELERMREEGEEGFGELERRDRERQKKERWQKRLSKYNKWYKEIKGKGILGYLKKG